MWNIQGEVTCLFFFLLDQESKSPKKYSVQIDIKQKKAAANPHIL